MSILVWIVSIGLVLALGIGAWLGLALASSLFYSSRKDREEW